MIFRIQEPEDGTITKICYNCYTYEANLIWDETAGAYKCEDSRQCYQTILDRHKLDTTRHQQFIADMDRYDFYDE